jgi:hypothetical protein
MLGKSSSVGGWHGELQARVKEKKERSLTLKGGFGMTAKNSKARLWASNGLKRSFASGTFVTVRNEIGFLFSAS